MNIKQAISIFLSIFNLAIDSDVKDTTPFDVIQIFDYKGESVGVIYPNNTENQYTIGIRSSELGVGVGRVIASENRYDVSCTFNSHMLHSPNRIYDTITNKMIISLGEETEISNSFTACKKRNVVMKFSASNITKNLDLMLNDDIAALTDDASKTVLDVRNLNVGGVEVTSYKSDNYVLYEFEPLDQTQKSSGGFTAKSDSITLENIAYPFPFVTSDFTIDFDIVNKLREASSQNASLNYFDNIFSLLLSSSKTFDKRETNAILGYIPYELTTTPKLNGVDVLYPQDKKPAKHIEN